MRRREGMEAERGADGLAKELEDAIGHGFARGELLEEALTHPSRAAESRTGSGTENQRLEFLGDAALGLVAAEMLVERHPEWREGTLTKVRSRLTNEETLARVARRLGLGKYLRLGRGEERGGGRERGALLADALEAVVGALWTDGGPEAARQFFRRWFAEEIEEAEEAGGDDNPKGELQERIQRERKESPRYETAEENGPAHARRFRVRVWLGEEKPGEGEGASKREAERAAARQALEGMGGRGEGGEEAEKDRKKGMPER